MTVAMVGSKLGDGWSRREIAAEGEGLTLGVELMETNQLIGDVMLHFQSAKHRGGEVGWILSRD